MEMNFRNTPVALGQVNRQRLEETMYVALSQFVGPGGAKR